MTEGKDFEYAPQLVGNSSKTDTDLPQAIANQTTPKWTGAVRNLSVTNINTQELSWIDKATNALYENDYDLAMENLDLAAYSNGNPQAIALLGFCHEFGLAVTRDFVKAERFYLDASLHGNSLAFARLSFLRKYGRPGVKMDRVESSEYASRVDDKAIDWLQRAAENGMACGIYAYGNCYHDGVGRSQDAAIAFKLYTKAACMGDSNAIGILGYCYGEGFGTLKDETLAFEFYCKAANMGCSVAMYNSAHCLEDGIGIEANIEKAISWYKRSALMGNCHSQNSIGYIYEEGLGGNKDLRLAVHWYKISADQGYAWAQCNLGYCLQNGIGVAKSLKFGAIWYKRASIQGLSRYITI